MTLCGDESVRLRPGRKGARTLATAGLFDLISMLPRTTRHGQAAPFRRGGRVHQSPRPRAPGGATSDSPGPNAGRRDGRRIKHVVRPCAPPTPRSEAFSLAPAGAALAERVHSRKHCNTMYIGTAAWTIPRDVAAAFPGDGQHLERYARQFPCAEINSSFHRPHARATYARWAAMTPPHFRFAVKLPRAITHDARLRQARRPLREFLDQAGGLGDRLGVLLVQLPPSFAWDAAVVRRFFGLLRESWDGPVACEPRHASWFEPAADRALARLRVSRVAADPARLPAAARPGGWLGDAGDGSGALLYWRWHGSPRVYYSSYPPAWLREQADALASWPAGAVPWVIFDNTASGAATADALALRPLVATAGRPIRVP